MYPNNVCPPHIVRVPEQSLLYYLRQKPERTYSETDFVTLVQSGTDDGNQSVWTFLINFSRKESMPANLMIKLIKVFQRIGFRPLYLAEMRRFRYHPRQKPERTYSETDFETLVQSGI